MSHGETTFFLFEYGMTSSARVNDCKLNDFKGGENMALFPLEDSIKVHQEL